MKKTTALIVIGAILAFFLGTTTGVVWAQKKSNMKEVTAGVIPTKYGELMGVSGDANSTTLVFRKTNNELGIVKIRGNKVPNMIMIIKRDY